MTRKMDSIILDDYELEIVREQTVKHNAEFDLTKREYTIEELASLKIVRESYSVQELNERGFARNGIVTSFDDIAKQAETELTVGAPFAKEVKKWQIPINMIGFRMMTTVFAPNTIVLPHVHTVLDQDVKSGGFRMVVQGSITFEGRKYLPGDWFFVPNGIPYSFITDPNIETRENYWYGHRHRNGLVRISSPKAVEE